MSGSQPRQRRTPPPSGWLTHSLTESMSDGSCSVGLPALLGTYQGGWAVRRHELIDQAWAEIAPLLPATSRPSGQWAEHYRVLNSILWRLATEVPSRDLPERYGPGRPAISGSAVGQADGTLAAAACTAITLPGQLQVGL
jgi:hypothetical protein